MPITLLCLVKGNTTASAFAVDIDRDKLVSHLKDAIKEKNAQTFANVDAKDLKLWKVTIPGDQDDQLRNLILQDSDELLAINDIGDYWPTSPPKKHIHVIVKLPLLSLEEALSCIPPPVTYSSDCNKKKTTTKVNGDPPTSIQLWDDFFDKVNQFRFDHQPRFERPQFIPDKVVLNEEDVRVAIDVNICLVLNRLTGAEYDFSKRPTHTPGIPDFNCHFLAKLLILVIEAKRKHVLEDMGEQTFPDFYKADEKARMVIQQIYNYMGENELRYGILATYDNHWFLRREHTKLWISKTLSLKSESPPVLKAYAYLARQAKEDPQSLNPLRVPVPAHGDNNSRVLRSHSKSTSTSSISQQSTSGSSTNQQSSGLNSANTSSNAPVDQQNFSFVDFKFKSILGEGRSGKTLLCEFRGDMIALKSVDLSKAPSYVLEEMQKEVEIYKDLADIQGKFIPKLVCYGYYGGGMCFVIGMTISGTSLSEHKLTKRQKTRAIKGLEAIHKHGILHNDIREENILINDNDDIYLIDFGMASRADTKKKRKLFEEERLKLSQLLDRYIVQFVKNVGRISKSRKCRVVS